LSTASQPTQPSQPRVPRLTKNTLSTKSHFQTPSSTTAQSPNPPRKDASSLTVELRDCILDDCKLANSSIYNSSFSCSRSKCTVSPLPYFNRIPPEIRDKTFSEAMEWNGKISVLIAALRGDPVLYHEALRILSKKGFFEFHSGNTQTRNMALPSSFKGMERVRSSKYLLLAIL